MRLRPEAVGFADAQVAGGAALALGPCFGGDAAHGL